jgi:hypothetical protein
MLCAGLCAPFFLGKQQGDPDWSIEHDMAAVAAPSFSRA